jgi:hypothetical protein
MVRYSTSVSDLIGILEVFSIGLFTVEKNPKDRKLKRTDSGTMIGQRKGVFGGVGSRCKNMGHKKVAEDLLSDYYCDVQSVKRLLELNADPNIKTPHGTALQLGLKYLGRQEVVQMLLEAKAEVCLIIITPIVLTLITYRSMPIPKCTASFGLGWTCLKTKLLQGCVFMMPFKEL